MFEKIKESYEERKKAAKQFNEYKQLVDNFHKAQASYPPSQIVPTSWQGTWQQVRKIRDNHRAGWTIYNTGDGTVQIEGADTVADVQDALGQIFDWSAGTTFSPEVRKSLRLLEEVFTEVMGNSAVIGGGKAEISVAGFEIAKQITQQMQDLIAADGTEEKDSEVRASVAVVEKTLRWLQDEVAAKVGGKFTLAVKTDIGVQEEFNIPKPPCPDHRIDMKYDAIKGRWRCPEPGCKKAARSKGTSLDTAGGKVVHDDLELVVMGVGDVKEGQEIDVDDRNIYLRLKNHNAMIPLAAFLVRGGVEVRHDGMTGVVELRGLPMLVIREEL